MRRAFKLAKLGSMVPPAARRDPRAPWKIGLAALGLANIAAFFLFVRPIGGSARDLDEELRRLQSSYRAEQQQVNRAKAIAAKLTTARTEQEKFMNSHFMDRRTASSTILTELGGAVKNAGLTLREHSFVIEPVEGTDRLGMMTISANYEGSYGDLIRFVNLMDHSPRFLIIDTIQAAPQQQTGKLAVRFRMNTFVREVGAREQAQ
jgi:type IV pilus assembly protein PilO